MITPRESVPLVPYTTFEIGGPARYLTEAHSESDVRSAVLWARGKALPHVVIGGGSNLLIPDDGLSALVIRLKSSHWEMKGATLEADAGATLSELIRLAGALGFGGWQKLSGIPGTIGGAVRGNAGAFGTEMKDVVAWVYALNTITFETHEFSNSECVFSYRMSIFKERPEWIILKVRVSLMRSSPVLVQRDIEETIAERERRHIQNVRAAGSYFINPVAPLEVRAQFEKEKNTAAREGRVPAGWLIEKAGLKGARTGGAEASVQHPNYLVNRNGATAKDVRKLAARIKRAVRAQFGIELREEAVVF